MYKQYKVSSKFHDANCLEYTACKSIVLPIFMSQLIFSYHSDHWFYSSSVKSMLSWLTLLCGSSSPWASCRTCVMSPPKYSVPRSNVSQFTRIKILVKSVVHPGSSCKAPHRTPLTIILHIPPCVRKFRRSDFNTSTKRALQLIPLFLHQVLCLIFERKSKLIHTWHLAADIVQSWYNGHEHNPVQI